MRRACAALVHKTWLETRGRFGAGLLLLVLMVAQAVVRAPSTVGAYAQAHPGSLGYGEYVWLSLYGGYLQALWIGCAVLLALGGVWREHALGTAGFTLSLPVRRGTVFLVRSGVALAEVLALGLLPAVLLAALSLPTANAYPFSEALRFSVCMTAGGLVFFGWGLLLSHLFRSEYAAPTVGIVSVAILFFVLKLPGLAPYNVFDLMSGAGRLDDRTYFFAAGLPWAGLGVCLLGALLLAAASWIILLRRDMA